LAKAGELIRQLGHCGLRDTQILPSAGTTPSIGHDRQALVLDTAIQVVRRRGRVAAVTARGAPAIAHGATFDSCPTRHQSFLRLDNARSPPQALRDKRMSPVP
jgi:hypothetical protein